jgi:hypothetical protein
MPESRVLTWGREERFVADDLTAVSGKTNGFD